MQISFYGLSCFRFSSKPGGRATEDIILYVDPLNEKGVRSVYGKADIVLCSQGEDKCSTEAFKGDAKVFDLPGEYSVQGVDIFGVDASRGSKKNTIFLFESEDVRIAHIGRADGDLGEKQLEKLDDVDVLLIPVGGNEFMDAKVAAEIVRKIEPKVVIPMMYQMAGSPYVLDDVKKFLNEMGSDSIPSIDRFVFKEKDLSEKRMQIILLSSQR